MNTCRFDTAVTPVEAIERAAYALAELLTVEYLRDPESTDIVVCTLHPRAEMSMDELAHRFRREVVDQVLRVRVGEQTAAVRDLIYAVAFSRTGLVEEVAPE